MAQRPAAARRPTTPLERWLAGVGVFLLVYAFLLLLGKTMSGRPAVVARWPGIEAQTGGPPPEGGSTADVPLVGSPVPAPRTESPVPAASREAAAAPLPGAEAASARGPRVRAFDGAGSVTREGEAGSPGGILSSLGPAPEPAPSDPRITVYRPKAIVTAAGTAGTLSGDRASLGPAPPGRSSSGETVAGDPGTVNESEGGGASSLAPSRPR